MTLRVSDLQWEWLAQHSQFLRCVALNVYYFLYENRNIWSYMIKYTIRCKNYCFKWIKYHSKATCTLFPNVTDHAFFIISAFFSWSKFHFDIYLVVGYRLSGYNPSNQYQSLFLGLLWSNWLRDWVGPRIRRWQRQKRFQ